MCQIGESIDQAIAMDCDEKAWGKDRMGDSAEVLFELEGGESQSYGRSTV